MSFENDFLFLEIWYSLQISTGTRDIFNNMGGIKPQKNS